MFTEFRRRVKSVSQSVSLSIDQEMTSIRRRLFRSRQNIIKQRRVDWSPVATAASTNQISQQSAAASLILYYCNAHTFSRYQYGF